MKKFFALLKKGKRKLITIFKVDFLTGTWEPLRLLAVCPQFPVLRKR